MSGPPRSSTECRLVGAASSEHLAGLLDALRALSGGEGSELHRYEVAHRQDGPPAVEVRLQRSMLPDALAAEGPRGPRWLVRNETLVAKRGAVRELPVAVVTVTEAASQGPDVPRFWEAMGTFSAGESLRQGRAFRLRAEGRTVSVTVSRLFSVRQPGDLGALAEVSPGHQLVELAARVPAGEHLAGSRALVRVQELLRDHVTLMKG